MKLIAAVCCLFLVVGCQDSNGDEIKDSMRAQEAQMVLKKERFDEQFEGAWDELDKQPEKPLFDEKFDNEFNSLRDK